MAGWAILHDPVDGVIWCSPPATVSASEAGEALVAVSNLVAAERTPSVIIADARAVRHLDPLAPLAAARALLSAAHKIEHLYVITDTPTVRAAAVAVARCIGVRFSCHREPPQLIGTHRVSA